MHPVNSSRESFFIFTLSMLSIFLGLSGGYPFHHVDTLFPHIISVLTHQGNPMFFNYPGLMIYLHAGIYALLFKATLITPDQLHSAFFYTGRFSAGPLSIPAYLPAQLLNQIFILTALLSLFRFLKQQTQTIWLTICGGLFLILSPLWVNDAHFMTVDIPLACLGWIVSIYSLRFDGETPRTKKEYFCCGILGGLCLATKYTGVIFILPWMMLQLFSPKQLKTLFRFENFLWLAGLGLAFLASNPYLLLDPVNFLESAYFELRHSRQGHVGYQNLFPIHQYSLALIHSYGILPLCLALSGMIIWIRFHTVSFSSRAVLFMTPIIYFLIISTSSLHFHRYLLPLFPFLAFFSAYGCFVIVKKLGRVGLILASVCLFVSFGINGAITWKQNQLLSTQDTREQLLHILESWEKKEPIVIESGKFIPRITNRLGNSEIQFQEVQEGAFLEAYQTWTEKNSQNKSLFIWDSFSADRLLYEPSTQPMVSVKNSGIFLFQITPHCREKEVIPFSAQSNYAPFLPDLFDRKAAGPYLEMMTKNPEIAEWLKWNCQKEENCRNLPVEKSFYLKKLLSLVSSGTK